MLFIRLYKLNIKGNIKFRESLTVSLIKDLSSKNRIAALKLGGYTGWRVAVHTDLICGAGKRVLVIHVYPEALLDAPDYPPPVCRCGLLGYMEAMGDPTSIS